VGLVSYMPSGSAEFSHSHHLLAYVSFALFMVLAMLTNVGGPNGQSCNATYACRLVEPLLQPSHCMALLRAVTCAGSLQVGVMMLP
jgi:hypothetical protein